MLEETVSNLSTLGPVRGVVGDVRQMSAGATMVQETVDAYGAIDILVCNAGITSVMPIEQLGEAEWDAVMNTNVKGMYTLIKAAIPFMKNQGGGKIVTLGSEMGIVAVPESPAYNASKGAVIMFTKSIAIDLIRYNIRVNSLCPGITQTPLLQTEVDNSIDPAATAAAQAIWAPVMRVANPREIAQGALFLASDESSFAVGSCLVLDGGYTAR
jgi:NAD(P)-dependent dehydrogenase (short-subunit alcohol dehydrogenase family)